MPAVVSAEINPPTSPSATHRRASLKVLSRNIDKVVLGNLVFPTWYYSPYPDNIVHDLEVSSTGGKPESTNHAINTVHHDGRQIAKHVHSVSSNHDALRHIGANHGHHGSMLDTLHVCPYCFRYTSSLNDYSGHFALHAKTEADYYAPTTRSRRKSQRRRAGSTDSERHVDNEEDDTDYAPKPVPDSAQKVYSHGGYTVWDVDGEVEKLYCQNLSLFGKLFLDQKSVFFDTAGFHYFVLTYCPPSSTTLSGQQSTTRDSLSSSPKSTRGSRDENSQALPKSTRKRGKSTTEAETGTVHAQHQPAPSLNQSGFPLRHQVLGFFSKENLSWDSNNLACILVFPPYQHRNLGQLLMAVSYKLSGWEWEDSIIGGPEKPLSTMGRKSYLRFWSERIARFLMGQSQDAEGLKVFEEGVMQESEDGTHQVLTGKKRKRKHGKGFLKDELTIKELGDRTGMLGEDVVAALIEMNVCDIIPTKRKKTQQHHNDKGVSSLNNNNVTTSHSKNDTDSHDPIPDLLTVTVNRTKVLEWANSHGVDLVSPVKEEGFLGEWALSEEGSEAGEENQNFPEGQEASLDEQ